MLKCEFCGKERKKGIRVTQTSILPEFFVGKTFCDDACLTGFIISKLRKEKIHGTIEYAYEDI